MIRGNYETLTLKLMEGLDSYPKYSEQPNETSFFTQLVCKVEVPDIGVIPALSGR